MNSAQAAHTETFVAKDQNELEKLVRKQHTLPDIARKLSELRTFEDWPKEIDDNYRLYVAVNWIEQNHFSQAAKILDTIDPKKTNQDLWRYYRSIALILSNQIETTSLDIETLEKKYPKDNDVLYLKSLYLANQDKFSEAIELLNIVIDTNKKFGKAYLQRGVYNVWRLSNEQAIKDFKLAIRYLPKNQIYQRQQAYLQVGLLYLRFKSDEKKAREYLKKGVELDPNSDLVLQLAQAIR